MHRGQPGMKERERGRIMSILTVSERQFIASEQKKTSQNSVSERKCVAWRICIYTSEMPEHEREKFVMLKMIERSMINGHGIFFKQFYNKIENTTIFEITR